MRAKCGVLPPHPRGGSAVALGVVSLAAVLAGLPGASAAEAHRWSDAQHMDQAAIAELQALGLSHQPDHKPAPLTTAYPMTPC